MRSTAALSITPLPKSLYKTNEHVVRAIGRVYNVFPSSLLSSFLPYHALFSKLK